MTARCPIHQIHQQNSQTPEGLNLHPASCKMHAYKYTGRLPHVDTCNIEIQTITQHTF